MGWHNDADRLTCNRIFRHLAAYGQRNFTGCLKVSVPGSEEPQWMLYLYWGRLAWATGGEHSRRRWYRQFCLATGKPPYMPEKTGLDRLCWDYQELYRLAQKTLSVEQAREIVRGVLVEVLFDLVQAFEQPLIARANGYSCLMDMSVLAGIGDGLYVTAHAGELPNDRCFPPSWYPTIGSLRQQVQAIWQEWVTVGLASYSPNHAPTIRNLPGLRRKTSQKAFDNLVRLLDGTRTLRDISLRFRSGKDLLKAARSLAPYICKGLISLEGVGDLLEPPSSSASKPTVVCITRARHTLEQVEFLATQAGYQVTWLSHLFEALYKFEQEHIAIPTLLFATIDLLPLSEEEFCTLLRRLPALRSLPIVLHSRQPLSHDRQQELAAMGVIEFLYGDVFDAARLWQQLARDRSPEVNTFQQQRQQRLQQWLQQQLLVSR